MPAGTLNSTQTALAGANPAGHPISIIIYNGDTVAETITLQFLPNGSSAQTMCVITLQPGDHMTFDNIPAGVNDVVNGAASPGNANVNYVTYTGPTTAKMGPTVYDSNGQPKSNTGGSGSALSFAANFRNKVDGGDFSINPWQRGTTQLADISNTLTYGPDRWALKGGASSAINFSKVTDATVAGFNNAFKYQRKSGNTDTAALNLCHVLETVDCYALQGQQVTLSFWAKKGANYSGGALTVQLETSTGTDQSANNLLAGSWTGQAHVVNGTIAAATLTTSMVRYSFTGTVPASCTQLGILLQWTPTGTAGADDSITYQGFQLEIGSSASAFEHRDAEVELAICQRYYVQFNEPASGVIVAAGHNSATNVQTFVMGLPTPMRAAPTVTVTVGSFKANSSTAGIVAATSLAASATHTPTQIGLTSSGTGTAGQGATLQGGGGVGLITVSADY